MISAESISFTMEKLLFFFFFVVHCQCHWGYWDCWYLTPPFHQLPLHIPPCLPVQRQQICAPCHSGGPGTRNHGFSSLWSIWAAVQAWQFCLWWVENKSESDHSSWTDSTRVSHMCMCAARVQPAVTAYAVPPLRCCTALHILSTELLQSLSDASPGRVDWDSSRGDLSKSLRGDCGAVQKINENTGDKNVSQDDNLCH